MGLFSRSERKILRSAEIPGARIGLRNKARAILDKANSGGNNGHRRRNQSGFVEMNRVSVRY